MWPYPGGSDTVCRRHPAYLQAWIATWQATGYLQAAWQQPEAEARATDNPPDGSMITRWAARLYIARPNRLNLPAATRQQASKPGQQGT